MANDIVTNTESPVSVTPSYRRNGKLFSCEPCRRGKLRCDHNSPVCGRCARRNKPDQCIYHPAPLTKPRSLSISERQQRIAASSSRASITAIPASSSRPSVNAVSTCEPNRPRGGLASPAPSSATTRTYTQQLPTANSQQQHQAFSAFRPLNATLSHNATFTSPFQSMATPSSAEGRQSSTVSYASPESSIISFRDSKAGFLGATSYSAVYSEHVTGLDVLTEPVEGDGSSTLPPVSSERIQQGADVLALLRDMSIYRRFMQRWLDLSDGLLLMSSACIIWIEDLWSEFGQILQDSRPDQLRTLSELVWRNTRKTIVVNGQSSARDWAKSVTGRNLRWEVVGTVLSLVGIIAMCLSDWDTIFDSIREKFVDRATFADRMRKASEFILCFCYESESLNELYVCFMYQELILVEAFKGDAHYASWQRAGELCDAIVAMGIHQGNPVDRERPFFLAELRKRIFTSVYCRDKYVASFLGRPPRLSHRYCKMEMPLDLPDEQLFLEGAELDAALSKLDENGWNIGGCVSRTTWGRVFFQQNRIREDILEIALGSSEDDIQYRAEQVQRKLEHLENTQPEFMKLQPEEVISQSLVRLGAAYQVGRTELVMSQTTCIFSICVHTGMVQTRFLLQRALINRGRADTKELIPLSRRMLELVLLAQSKRAFFRDFQGDLVYLMATAGLPAAGVLAIELLKQEQSRQYTPDILPRSETIQDLSVFISSLGNIGPGEGNYSICNQGRRVLKKVLDQILSPASSYPLSNAMGIDGQSVIGGSGQHQDDMSFLFPTGNDAEFLHWLDNVEWNAAG